MSKDYKSTIFLPKTDFAMRAGLPELEPKILKRWEKQNLHLELRESSLNNPKFILHDGPPYANGHLHIGTALNKVLKDIVTRSKQMMGFNSHYVPGWDCHGLPIEWQVEQEYIKEGKDKDTVGINEFRKDCREYAEKWIEVQRNEFKRLGVEGDWQARYATMDFDSEATIASEICKFLVNGGLYRGAKPVMWSVVEKTALAEAEVEYKDHLTTTSTVKFEITSKTIESFRGAKILIWTTTPWTLPGNRAIAYGSKIEYVVATINSVEDNSKALPGDKVILAVNTLEKVKKESLVSDWSISNSFEGSDLSGLVCKHPLSKIGYDYDIPLFPADFVNTEQGTGFVHIAPGHGADDFEIGLKHNIEIKSIIDSDGVYLESIPGFKGKRVLTKNGKEGDANISVLEKIEELNNLFSISKITHSYPHSWRSKAPIIFLTTPQWFISMDKNDLRANALKAIEQVKWVPDQGKARIYSMIENRPEWVISRQRAWGVPITVFVNKETGKPLVDLEVNKRIVSIFMKEGSDSWFSDENGKRFLGEKYNPNEWEKINDIVDVWFESGCSHVFVLEKRKELSWPASLYLEGSDQHRGWFHSSLLESCGTRGKAPYETVLTHGFVVDNNGRKMSKSLGNVVRPDEVIDKYGADILRLWVVASDYTDDLRIGNEILKGQVDAYRKIRNTFRYIIGNLSGFDRSNYVSYEKMPSLEKWVLYRIYELDELVRKKFSNFDFHSAYTALHNFCANDLSAFYFDVRKDSLYCDSKNSLTRSSVGVVLNKLFDFLISWFAPILCFTTEEAWISRYGENTKSVHLQQFPRVPEEWKSFVDSDKWEIIRSVRRVVTGAIEVERKNKNIGSSLEVCPKVYLDKEKINACLNINMADLCITSSIEILDLSAEVNGFKLESVSGVEVVINDANGKKCLRCWKISEEVCDSQEVCNRCSEATSCMEGFN